MAVLVSIAVTPAGRVPMFAGWAALLAALVVVSRVPAAYVAAKAAIVLPFVAVVAIGLPFFREGEALWFLALGPVRLGLTRAGVEMFLSVIARSYLAAATLVLLAATTRFAVLLRAMESLGAPRLLILILSFMYRYLFVLVDEAEAIETGWKARTPGGTGWRHLKVAAGVVGLLFVRTFERAEKVYQGMLARGFRGDAVVLTGFCLKRSDAAAAALLAAALGLVWGQR